MTYKTLKFRNEISAYLMRGYSGSRVVFVL